jgi:hypothetical protein
MLSVANFIINTNKIDEPICESIIQNGVDISMEIDEMCDELFKVIDRSQITDLTLFPDNLGLQRKTVISFKIHGNLCEIGEHYGTQRDYFYVRISPI